MFCAKFDSQAAHLKHFATFILKLHFTPPKLQCELDFVTLQQHVMSFRSAKT